jgi:alkylated DNA repair dioxygenase AlkB|tara:strand:- start:70 stop:663 length:594 start_codon:yes stop_codon:yes gene_type:complete
MSLLVKQIFDEVECEEIFNFLDTIKVEYHKEYKGMYGRMMKVPRGQASFTLNTNIHYDYKVSGGSPPNYIMCDRLKSITTKVNSSLGSHFNTILMNVYRGGEDCISFHKDKETGWVEGTGFATVSFGSERDFQIRHNESKDTTTISHKQGLCIYMPFPMNDNYQHGVPKRKRVVGTRISLTFRQIAEKSQELNLDLQ